MVYVNHLFSPGGAKALPKSHKIKMVILVSTKPGKKYMVRRDGRLIHFGQRGYEQFKDSTKLKKFSKLDHKDRARRKRFFKRMTGKGTKVAALKEAQRRKHWAKWYSIKFLW